MGDLVIKAAASNSLKIQSDNATNVLTVGTDDSVTLGTEFKVTSTSQTFTIKGIDAAITDSQTADPNVADPDSGQLAIYNGSTKLWGINESGWVQQPNRPCFFVTPTTDYTPPSGNHVFQANYALYNVGNMYDTSTYRFTAPIEGLYLFGGMYRKDANLSYIHWEVHINGTQVSTSTHGLIGLNTTGYSGFTSGAMTYQLQLNAGDYIDFYIYNNSTSRINRQSYLHGVFLG